ncbi:MAG: PAS domain S-box protein [Bryobacteraceae bacterium]
MEKVLQELRESQERFRTLFEDAPIAYHEIDRDGILRRLNRAECELFGLKAEEMLGRPVWEFVTPDERENSREAVRRKMAGEQPLAPFEREFNRADGTRVTLEIHEKYIRDAEGRIAGIRSAMLDVSARRAALASAALEKEVAERRRAEQRLALQYAAIRALSESPHLDAAANRLLEAICRRLRLDFGVCWLLESETLRLRALWSPNEPPSAAQLFRESLFGPDQALPGQIWSRQKPAAATGDLHQLMGWSGEGPQVFALAFPIMAGSRIHGVMAAFGPPATAGDAELLQTMSLLGRQLAQFIDRKTAEQALQESERRFAAFMSNLPGIAFIRDAAGKVLYLNAAAAALPAGERDVLLAASANYTEVGSRSWLVCKFPLPDGEGGIAFDVTERTQLEDQLRHAQKMEAVGRLAGGVAHDFNNMLTIIGGYGRMVIDKLPPGDRARATLELMLEAADRAAVLTGQLLAFSRRGVVQARVLDLNQVVSGMENMLRRLIGEHIELHTRLDASIPPVKADSGQLEQVLMNLAVNARDAMPEGGVLTIETAAAGNAVRLTVSDTGAGMTDDVKSRAFEPYFTTKGRGKGTGLGLSMVYGIVSRHGGEVRLESQPGEGARIDITLPAAGGSESETRHAPRRSATLKGTETVLLVEDEAALRRLARDILTSSGYRVLEARDGVDALQTAGAEPGPIHLVVTDMVMPRMGGSELAAEIRRRREGIRVLYMSGYTDDTIHAGVAERPNFLAKPFTPDALARKVREVLDETYS